MTAIVLRLRQRFDKPLGEGSIEWAKVRQELSSIDYHGWATAEVKGGDRARLADIASQMDNVNGQLQRMPSLK